SLAEAFCAMGVCDEAGLRKAAAALAGGSPTDRERGHILAGWCEQPETRSEMFDDYLWAFLTDAGGVRSTLITNGAAAKEGCGDARAALDAEAGRILRFLERRAAAALAEATGALIRLGAAVLRAYEHQKRLHGALDYDDLVLKTLELLRRPGIAPWVLFKLDGGL